VIVARVAGSQVFARDQRVLLRASGSVLAWPDDASAEAPHPGTIS